MKRVTFIVLYLILILPHLGEAGIVIEEMSYSKSTPSEKEKTITYISRNRVKVMESDGNYMLWDFNKGTLYIVNPHKKYYAGGIMVEEFIKELKEIKEAIRKIQHEIEKEIEKSFEMSFEKSFEKTPPTELTTKEKVTVKNTGQVTTIAGYPATKYAVYRDGSLESEVWLSPEAEAEIKKELDYKKFEKLLRELERAMEVEFGPSSIDEEDLQTNELDWLDEQGWEMKEVNHYFGNVSEVIKIKKMDIPDKEFVLPSGYKKVSTKIFMGLGDEK